MKHSIFTEGLGHSPALRWLYAILFLLLWSVGIGLVSLFFVALTMGRELMFSYLSTPLLLFLNLLPALLLALLLLGITNRVWPAVLGSGILVLGGAFINYFKLLTRDDPLLMEDIQYIAEASNISSRYTLSISPLMVVCVIALIFATLAAIFLLKARFSRPIGRVIFLLVSISLCLGAYFGLYRNENIYRATVNLDIPFSNGRIMSQWNDRDQYCGRGFLYPFLHSSKNLGPEKPKGYSIKAAETLLADYEGADIPDDKKVNFISIMLEAYSDLSCYEQLQFTTDPYAFLHALQAESIHGDLVTNIFAAGTIDTERCYISGSTELYKYRAPADSYARWFASQGYTTTFCHPGYAWFYNRRNVSEYIGFQSSHFDEDTYQYSDHYLIMPDKEFFPTLVEDLAGAQTPYFNFSVTYQNHGPYTVDSLYADRQYVARNGMSEESYNILNNYLSGIHDTDEALRDMVTSLKATDKPVVLVLFGDHKPWLGDGSSVYQELGIDLSRENEDGFYNYYHTPYIIWANDAAKAVLDNDFAGEGGDFSPCFLMMKLMDACAYRGDAYMDCLRQLYREVDVVNASGRYRENGVLTEQLSGSAREALDKTLILQYYRMHDAVR